MAVSVSKAGPYYSSGQIKFSDLRRDFRAQQRKTTSGGSETFSTDNGSISASELLRDIDTTEQSPIVPDCKENRESGPLSNGISASSNWKVSQFRNSIKYYYVTLPSSDEVANFDIDAQSWNTNLDKNINKFMFIDGTCGSSSVSSPAAAFSATAHNLTVDVYGDILGCGGRGGGTSGAPAIDGEDGGDALSMASSGGNNIVVLVRNGSRIYGGGGGGEKGKKGANGSSGTCYQENIYQYCSPTIRSGDCMGVGGSYQSTRRPGCCRSTMGGGCVESVYQNICLKSQSTGTPEGGAGGNGGPGRGYNYQSGSLDGAGGGSNSCPSCPGGYNNLSGGSCSSIGETGGTGGEWGGEGTNTDNTGSGGDSGRAVAGSNYSVSGTINSATVKGAYNP